jgi:hypothetical protein
MGRSLSGGGFHEKRDLGAFVLSDAGGDLRASELPGADGIEFLGQFGKD